MIDLPWQPLLEADRAAEARDTAFEIVAALEELPPNPLPGLKGEAATALLLAHCGRDTAAERLELALSSAVEQPTTVALFGGLAGTSWVVEQLVDRAQAEPVLAQFDAALQRYLEVPRWEDRFDLVSGIAGIGISVAGRRDNRAVRMAELVVSHLEATALVRGAGVAWRTPAQFLPERWRQRLPNGAIEFGVAHGVTGIIGMLARFVENDLYAARSARLLERAIDWILSAEPGGASGRSACEPEVRVRRDSIGWCDGKAGVAGALLYCSSVLGSTALRAEACARLLQIANSHAHITESGLCSGAAGLAHVFNAAFQRTHDALLRGEAERWIAELLGLRRPGIGIAGYASRRMDRGAARWEADTKLITGVVGIALVLLAATEEREPAWQQLFVL